MRYDYDITEYLYDALLQVYADHYKETTGRELPSSYSTIYSDMFVNVESINIDGRGISSLEGLNKLQFPKLVSFSANENFITSFNGSEFDNVNDWIFSELSLSNNEIGSVDLTDLVGLRKVDFSCNNLTTIDFSSIKGKTSDTQIEINLAGNDISSISEIKLPNFRISHIKLNIIGNNITDLSDEYFTDMYTLNIGVQGFKSDSLVKSDTSKGLLFYKTNIDNLSLKIIKTD